LFINIRIAASCCQPLQVIVTPRGARTSREPSDALAEIDVMVTSR
jgi:hypothetical protein